MSKAKAEKGLYVVTRGWWSLPFWCEYAGRTVRLERACPFTGAQEREIALLLEPSGAEKRGVFWHVPALFFAAIAAPVPSHLSPDSLVKWNPSQPAIPIPPPATSGLSAQEEAFLRDFWERHRAGGETFGELVVLWRMIGNHAMHWMINKEKPVEFGFLTLHPVPFRPGWRTLVNEWVPGVISALRRIASAVRKRCHANNSNFPGIMADERLLAINPKTRCIHRFVEVTMGKLWWKNVDRRERKRRATLGPHGYAKAVEASVGRATESAYALLVETLATSSRPCGKLVDRERAGRVELVPYHAKKCLRKDFVPNPDLDFLGGNPHAPAVAPENLEAENEGLSSVPDLQQPPENVRDGGCDSERRVSVGLPLLDASQGQDSGKLLGV